MGAVSGSKAAKMEIKTSLPWTQPCHSEFRYMVSLSEKPGFLLPIKEQRDQVCLAKPNFEAACESVNIKGIFSHQGMVMPQSG